MMRLSSSWTLLLALGLGLSAASSIVELSDANDVLNELSNYDKLYVSYQNCAWSAYANGCDVQGGEDEETWYVGLTECYRANVAYSLYGVKKGEQDKGCSKATFINSFFTTSGIETFTAYMATAGVSFSENDDANQVTSDCNVVEGEQDDQANNNNNNYAVNNRKMYQGYTSYGVGCVDNAFALKEYQGIYCDERSEPTVTDSMKTFNAEISQAQCVVIYDASSSSNNQNNEGENDEEGDALGLLIYSEACNIRNFPKKCPDPYGKLNQQAKAISSMVAAEEHPKREKAKTVISWILLCFGIILLIAAAWAYQRKKRAVRETEAQQKSQKKGLFGQKKNQSQSQSKDKKTGFWGKLRKGKGRS